MAAISHFANGEDAGRQFCGHLPDRSFISAIDTAGNLAAICRFGLIIVCL